jgi:hypothetical protein
MNLGNRDWRITYQTDNEVIRNNKYITLHFIQQI